MQSDALPHRVVLARRWMLSSLPLGTIACVVAAVVIWTTYPGRPKLHGTYLLIYGLSFLLVIPAIRRVRTAVQMDALSLYVMLGASAATWMAALFIEDDPAVSPAALMMVGALCFVSWRSYALYVSLALLGLVIARSASGYTLDLNTLHVAILGPVFGLIARAGVEGLLRSSAEAEEELTEKIAELEEQRSLRVASEKQLVHAQKMEGLGLLAAGVAHGFNNQLQSISAFSELIADGGDEPEEIRHIQAATARLAGICRQMLAYAGRTQAEQSALGLVSLFEEVRPLLTAGIPKHIAVDFILPEEEVYVRANSSALHQCLTNLVNNALDALPESGGRLRVTADSCVLETLGVWRVFGEPFEGAGVFLEVQDNGSGMSSEVLERAFDPYFTTKTTGHGFGLATTFGLVRGFGGVMRCQTTPGAGTRIQIVLPESDPPTGAVHSSAELRDPANRYRVLLVDDEEPIRHSLSTLLERGGFEVVTASSAAEALERIGAESSFDLYLLDYSMPEKTGLELLEELRAAGDDTLTAICSGFAEESVMGERGVRPDVFLTKPFRLRDVEELVDRHGAA
ncbi:MAG: ATP-binding protein [Acidobacteriota bacterium]